MNSIERLTERFRQFPGIGPRQARRFVYFLLTRNREYLEELSELITTIKKEIRVCPSCMRFFANSKSPTCPICVDYNRDASQLMIVEKDVDLENIERAGAYQGFYFVLGGTVPILEKNPEQRIRLKELTSKISQELDKGTLKEIILAFSVNAEGEHTTSTLRENLHSLQEKHGFKITTLGRGLSVGSELEYTDKETLGSALSGRQ